MAAANTPAVAELHAPQPRLAPFAVVVTPPTFQDSPPPPGTSGLTSSPLVIPALPAAPPPTDANVVVTPVTPPTASTAGVSVGVGSLTAAEVPAFRISASVPAGQTMTVQYTLSAHDATGTASVSGVVTLTEQAGPVTVPATPVLAGRSPDVLTLTISEQPGVRPARPSATLFLTPAAKVGDSALFEAHRVGRSPEAFRVILERHGGRVTQACQKIVGNRADAQDVSQFVFLELSKFSRRFPGTLAAWLRAVSRNASLAFLRAKRRRLRRELAVAKEAAVDAPPPVLANEALASALGQLPPEQAEAVRLRYLEGYTQQEAAAAAGVPRGTLSRRAADGIQALRALLGDHADG